MNEYSYNLSEWMSIDVLMHNIDEESSIDIGNLCYCHQHEDSSVDLCFTQALTTSEETELDGKMNTIVYDSWIERVKDNIDLNTDDFIQNSFVWNSIKFCLDIEHQMSYKGAHDIRDELTYPYKIKGVGSHYYMLADAAEFHTFLLAAFTHIETQLQTGWTLKDGLSSLTLQQLKDYVDPRL